MNFLRQFFVKEAGTAAMSTSAAAGGRVDLSTLKVAIEQESVVLVSKTTCGYCSAAERLLLQKRITPKVFYVDVLPGGHELHSALIQSSGQRTVPYAYVKGKLVGGYTDLASLDDSGRLDELLQAQ
jgi:glutaredoxin 3